MDWILYLFEKAIHSLRVNLKRKIDYINKKNIKLDLGCGGIKKKGFFGIDAILGPNVDLEFNLENGIPFSNNSIAEIYSSHFLEHLSNKKALFLISEIKRVLKKNGKLTLVVPDLEKTINDFLKMSEKNKWNFGWEWIFGNQKKDYEYHKTGFSKNRLKSILEENGFKKISVKNINSKVPSILAKAIK